MCYNERFLVVIIMAKFLGFQSKFYARADSKSIIDIVLSNLKNPISPIICFFNVIDIINCVVDDYIWGFKILNIISFSMSYKSMAEKAITIVNDRSNS